MCNGSNLSVTVSRRGFYEKKQIRLISPFHGGCDRSDASCRHFLSHKCGGCWGTSFTNCYIYWNQVSGADGYQTVWSWTDGSHAKYSYHASNSYGVYVSNAPNNHVSMVKVRAFRWVKGKRSYGPWSNIAFITPSPSSISGSIVSSTASSPKERLRWNVIYGSDGYNVFLTTNPRASWRWNQSTAAKATANTAVISKYAGGKLKTYTNYYFRLVTRRKRNGVFCTVPMPSSTYYSGYFWFYRY